MSSLQSFILPFWSGRVCAAVALLVISANLALWAGKDFVMPTAQPAKSYVAHDEHSTELVAVGLDPYDAPDKAKIFSVHYQELGFVPIFVVITNDGDQAVSLRGMTAQLITADRTKVAPAEEGDIYRRLSHPNANPNSRLPLPGSGKVKGGVNKQAQEEIGRARFGAKAVEPHSSQSGFMFFDVSGMSSPLVGARFYLTGVRDAKGDEMMYFEVPLGEHANPPTKSAEN